MRENSEKTRDGLQPRSRNSYPLYVCTLLLYLTPTPSPRVERGLPAPVLPLSGGWNVCAAYAGARGVR